MKKIYNLINLFCFLVVVIVMFVFLINDGNTLLRIVYAILLIWGVANIVINLRSIKSIMQDKE